MSDWARWGIGPKAEASAFVGGPWTYHVSDGSEVVRVANGCHSVALAKLVRGHVTDGRSLGGFTPRKSDEVPNFRAHARVSWGRRWLNHRNGPHPHPESWSGALRCYRHFERAAGSRLRVLPQTA
jgi:hypothetical protein